jgi:hypothetical protein
MIRIANADAPDFVLEEHAQRLDEHHLHVLGQAADVVVRLDLRRDAFVAAGLDHVGVQRPLHEVADAAETARLGLEHADELLADAPPLLLGVVDAREPREEALLRVDVHERHVEVVAERLDDLRRLVLAQEAVVDEHARELVADRLVDEERGDGGVDAAGEGAEHAVAPDLRADPLDLLLDDGGRGPRRGGAGDVVEEVLQQVVAVRRVHDLRVELHPVEAAAGILERRHRRRGRSRDDAGARRRRGHRVAVRHPHGLLARQVAEELALLGEQVRLPELGRTRSLDAPAEVERHQLRAVADAEGGDAGLEDAVVDAGRAVGVDGRGAAGEDDRVRVARADRVRRHAVRHELGVHPRLAHAARDQLRVLAAEVDDEDGAFLRRRLGRGERKHLSADSSAPPS